MKATHRIKDGKPDAGGEVTAWQYLKTNNVPLWVFRNFHNLGDGDVLTARDLSKVHLGNWIIAVDGFAYVFSKEEFEENFEAIT